MKDELITIKAIPQFTKYEKDGWRVVKYRAEESTDAKTFTARGQDLPNTANVSALLYGVWTEDKHGRQFDVRFSEVCLPTNEKGVISYLQSLKIRIGARKAALIYEAFGDQIWDVLDNEPERLKSVKGISTKIATNLIAKLQETQALRQVLKLFQGACDITIQKAKAVLDKFEDEASYIVQNSPYRLCEVRGFTFTAVDAMALSRGLPPDNPARLNASIFHVFREVSAKGHVCIPAKELCDEMQKVLGQKNGQPVSADACQAAITAAYKRRDIHCTSGMLYLKHQFLREQYIATTLKKMASRNSAIENIDIFLDQYQKDTGITLAEKQAEAVRCCLRNSVSVITGGPGTGKTTTIRALLYVHKLIYGNASEPLLMAPTGRAARRMSEATGYPASTIHAAIGYSERSGQPEACTPLSGNIIIVDESSMIEQLIAYLMLQMTPETTRLVFVGDPDQLPSVGCGDILHDIIRSGAVPVTKLDVIYRQGADSPVITNAHAINTGKTTLSYEKGFKFLQQSSPSDIFETACKFYIRCVNSYGIDNVILLNPYRSKTYLNVNDFNKRIQDELNPLKPGAMSIQAHGVDFRENDKVMQTRNTDDAKNGDIGYIRHIERRPAKDDPTEWEYFALIEFNDDGILCTYSADALKDVDLAYCSTVHKSQGSQYETVIMVISNLHTMALKRNLVYTGITRAEKNVALIGEESALVKAIQNNAADVRYTLLAERLYNAT